MESSIHRFARILRLSGLRISSSEIIDASRAAAAVEVRDREALRSALMVCLVKDRRHRELFDDLYDLFFRLLPVRPGDDGHGHDHAHDDLVDEGELEKLTMSEEPSDTPQQGHDHGKPSDIKEYFDEQDMAQQYNAHQEANKIDIASLTEELVFSKDLDGPSSDGRRVQLETSRLHNAGNPGDLAAGGGTTLDTEMTIAEEQALQGWLEDSDADIDPELLAKLRGRLTGIVENLPELLKAHLAKLAALETAAIDGADVQPAYVERVTERERAQLEESIRHLAATLRGGLTHRKAVSARGRINVGRTMRENMRYDAVPFRPVTVSMKEDKPRLVVLADVSLSVRSTSRFTLHLVHGLQALFSQVRTFAFVSDLVEITDLFEEHPIEHALGLVFGGDVLDVDATSDYGAALGQFQEDYISAVNRRSTVLVLGDGRGNGNDPNMDAFTEITRRARTTLWLTPEPQFSWTLGRCDLPLYAELCDRVEVVRDLSGLSRVAEEMSAAPS